MAQVGRESLPSGPSGWGGGWPEAPGPKDRTRNGGAQSKRKATSTHPGLHLNFRVVLVLRELTCTDYMFKNTALA